ncbi:Nitroreductase [Marinobacter daqiaonensis]|uniref:Putative NAD(P)H nitroreductase n=1 Tax=Marinobacter daqiaonensis TaxID=650891 RepID=A0A1I6GKP2_9GAMM|nr:nitroreductase family protein [Marinobacter daqiaonensis]SFR42764.1 Nitroreductase [Marinobacter daqiaonensis]
MDTVTEAILNRSSEPRLKAPAPSGSALELALACAARAPDHALLRPWRYLVVEGEGLEELGRLFESSAPEDATDAAREKLRRMPLRAPMIIAAIASPVPHPKVPALEQCYSTAAGAAYLVLALQAEGYGAMWRTGSVAESPVVARGLGLAEHETIVGFIYTGTVADDKPAVPRPGVSEFSSRWPA